MVEVSREVVHADRPDSVNVAWSRWQTIKHQYFDALMLVGLRDRLRCPKCSAVGTYKPHGGWCDKFNDWRTAYRGLREAFMRGAQYATTRRWVCKYCGYTRDINGEHFGAPDKVLSVWAERGANSGSTPKEAVELVCGKVWPWRG